MKNLESFNQALLQEQANYPVEDPSFRLVQTKFPQVQVKYLMVQAK